MKLLFLITALNLEIRTKLRDDYHGLSYLVEALNLVMKESSENQATTIPLNDKQVDLLCEILRVLFNVTVRNEASVSREEEEEIQFRRLAIVMHDLLLCPAESPEKQFELQSNTINLLTNIPTECFSELVVAVHPATIADTNETASNDSIFEGNDTTALKVMLEFLKVRSQNVDVSFHRSISYST